MERVPELLKSKIMSADQAAQLIHTGIPFLSSHL